MSNFSVMEYTLEDEPLVQKPDGFVFVGNGSISVRNPWRDECSRVAREKIANSEKNKLERLRQATARREREELRSEVGRAKKIIKDVLASQSVINIEGCMAWAFGPYWNQIPMNDYWRAWNFIHRDMFKIQPSDGFEDTFTRIGRAYVVFMNKYFKGNQFPVIGRDFNGV